MAFNPFIGWAQADLEKELLKRQKEYAAGRQTTQASGAGYSSTFERDQSLLTTIEQLYKALNILDADAYPIDQIKRTTQARVIFTQSPTPTDSTNQGA